jgi:Kef-type K+ transport system membrane component KefB
MGLVVAVVGAKLGILNQELFAVIVLMAVATSFIGPILLKIIAARLPLSAEERARA